MLDLYVFGREGQSNRPTMSHVYCLVCKMSTQYVSKDGWGFLLCLWPTDTAQSGSRIVEYGCVKTCTILYSHVSECSLSFTVRLAIPGLTTDSHSVEKAPYRKEVILPRWYKAIKKCANLLVPSYPPWAPFYGGWCRPCWALSYTRLGSMVV